ncbi:uncharacterized protein AB675_7171 [Cyphellophora attinorum]|uniref:Magnesium transport protein CorA n=1 Tax=Cyphellophora attinorum TaxID=1664694 RepID=A0A0N1H8M1_9EURO|nr:uncharacterized protein AB675_7171 [Phialophora attinorum]KPI43435.1 hypothetical protein AB675_7171 [Phialophora attinorum]
MALDNDTVKQLLGKLEADRAAYQATQNKLYEALIQVLHQQNGALPLQPDSFLPPHFQRSLSAESEGDTGSFRKPQSLTSRRTGSITLDGAGKKITSLYSAEDSSDSEDGESYYANEPLSEALFTEEDLREHIRRHDWNHYEQLIFGPLKRSSRLYSPVSLFADGEHTSDADHTTADIYEVGEDGAPLQRSRSDVVHGDLAAWDVIRATNADKTRKQAVGRIIVLREPSPLLYGALHLAMSKHFDMDSIYQMLISDQQRTKAYVSGANHSDHRHQRSLVFCFKYHTLVGDNREPLEWQNHDDELHEKEDHIPISTCSAVPPHPQAEHSHVYDPFAPWHVITVQNFPDWNSSMDLHETNHHYVNGPDAFLVTLLHEYRDAAKRFRELAAKVTHFTMPARKAMFDDRLRDELLFESGDFVFTRRYFWASQTLGILSEEVDAMVNTYRDTFTDEVWAGEHRTLFPGAASTSARFANWRKKMVHTRKQFDAVITTLLSIQRTINKEQKEIKNLREWLFSGTSVQESRQAVKQALITVEQGYNIKLLTLVTIFFLPLMFVTGVFGMTNMPPEDDFVPAIAMACGVCLPTYLLIAVINKPEAFQKGVAWLLWPWVLCYDWTKKSEELAVGYAARYREKYLTRVKMKKGEKAAQKGGWMGFQSGGHGRGWGRNRSATFASLDARLEQERQMSGSGSVGGGRAIGGGRRASRPFAFAQPSDTAVDVSYTATAGKSDSGRPMTLGGSARPPPFPTGADPNSRDITNSLMSATPPKVAHSRRNTRESTIRFDTSTFHSRERSTPQHSSGPSVNPSPHASVGQLTVTETSDTGPGHVSETVNEGLAPYDNRMVRNDTAVSVPEITVDSPTTPPRAQRPGFLRRLSSRIGTGGAHGDGKSQV